MFQGKPVLRYTSAPARVFTAILLAFIVVTRWPLAPHRLYYFDSANFALALEHFNPALHQPQPPGYPLFVALTRIIYLWVANPEQVLLIAGLLAACAATLLIRVLAADLFGPSAGLLAAALLASNPVFWFGGLTNQIRVFLALSALGVALLAWRALTRPASPRWFYACFAAIGIAGGFRPVESVLLVPMVLWVWWRTGRGLRRLALGCALAALTTLPWLAATVVASGGVLRLVDIMRDYAHVQFEGSSAVFGASVPAAWRMLAEAVVWNFLGALAWIWALPLALRHQARTPDFRRKIEFLAVGFLPSFLFSAIIHIGDPDQALASVSILCVFGGGVLAAVLDRFGSRRVLTLACAVIAFHALLFFRPPGKLARAASYHTVAAVDRMNNAALGAIDSLRRDGPLTIVHWGSSVASRHLAYYFPEDYVIVFPGAPGVPAPGQTPEMFYHHHAVSPPAGAAGVLRPGSHQIVCLLPFNARPSDLPGWRRFGAVYVRDIPGTAPIPIGPYTLAPPVQ